MTAKSATAMKRGTLRAREFDKGLLAAWTTEVHCKKSKKYTHRLLKQALPVGDNVLKELQRYVDDALLDAVRNMRLGDDAISPFVGGPSSPGELVGFPYKLPDATLLGYLGEILAGATAEAVDIHGRDGWVVPAFFFRFHQGAFHYIQHAPTLPQIKTAIGRPGDDVIALHFNSENQLDGILVVEAKCLSGHRSNKDHDAHKQLSGTGIPVGLRELLLILREYGEDPTAERARLAIVDLLRRTTDARTIPRHDMVLYMTGNKPAEGRTSWISDSDVSPHYSGGRPLEVVEVHAEQLSQLMSDLLRRGL